MRTRLATLALIPFIAGVTACGSTSSGGPSGCGGSGDIVIGVISPATGAQAVIVGSFNEGAKQAAADINSYQVLLKYPEIDAHGRGIEFRQPIIWRNAPDPDHQRYHAVITWRDGRLLEHLKIDRLTNSGDARHHTSMDEWAWSMDLQDGETGEILVDCRNKGLGLGLTVRTPKLQSCFP